MNQIIVKSPVDPELIRSFLEIRLRDFGLEFVKELNRATGENHEVSVIIEWVKE